jgi:hypothetical protein
MAVDMPIDDGNEIPAAGVRAVAAGGLSAPDSPLVVGEAAMASDTGYLPITLAFDDLLPDLNGEIVVMGTGFGAQLSIVTDQKICAEGVADSHFTAEGVDVGGLAFFAFEGGTKLYYSPEIEVTIAPANG